ncbi:hypothetical protein FisN_10Lh181 [Fistulifera solaris]|uniref:RNase H type-1 domain-containing protein n=1 Tax=Fistulifera solaris TaxID=1519565 RepID=A0A1Z5JTH5_FISSO|nr:hypothetical protein FisN_10Lh181 [Fistulifera solaris]|eukprot:GAX17317.1 hypothetical protein FisN_10Lh181 [Fistulifera solaris]
MQTIQKKRIPAFFFLIFHIVRCFPNAKIGWNSYHPTKRGLLLAITAEELASHSNITIRYSHNFRRHIVEKNGVVVQSYFWLDQALQQYPRAKLLPVYPIAMIAGTSFYDSQAYPFHANALSASENRLQLIDLLCEHLKWGSTQANGLLDRWSGFELYPVDLLRERIEFLMAPLPEEELLLKVNYTENIDWPVQLLRHGRGCGLSLAQVSHALQVLPQFILRLPQVPSARAVDPSLLKLNEETPSISVVMTGDRMEAWLAGASVAETLALGYLQWRGWTWMEFKLLLHAFPSILQPALEPNWDIKGRVRNQLRPDVLHYLQARLQLRPWHLQAMLRTHSALSTYKLSLIQRNMDFLQGALQLQSDQLRQILLEMPSLLGVSTISLQKRLDFWRFEVGLTTSRLKACSLEKASLLHCSVDDNLRRKLSFFRNDLNISAESLIGLTMSRPVIWAYSLEKNLAPTAQSFVNYCGNMTLNDYGLLVTKVPQVLRSSWKTNLSIKLKFLRETLSLSDFELCDLIKAVPWVMIQSMKTLELKMSIFREELGSDGLLAVKRNPSLLLSSPDALDKRVRRCLEHATGDVSVFHLLTGSDEEKASVRRRRVYLLKRDSSQIEAEFAGVPDAANYAGMSQSRMYRALQLGLPVQGRRFAYAKPTEQSSQANISQVIMESEFASLSLLARNGPPLDRFCVDVAGYAYPPGLRVRGRKRSGGVALHVAAWSIRDWRKYFHVWSGRKYKLLQDEKTMILGYHYIRASRPRCSLFACHEALRIARLWLAETRLKSADIEIRSDSSYVVDLLQNTTRLLKWGKMERLEKCDFSDLGDPKTTYTANPDILYTVARSYYFLIRQENIADNERVQVKVHFSFSPASSKPGAYARRGAKVAAQLIYDASRP